MSLSVNGSSNNPFANLQYLLQQSASQGTTSDQSNPLTALLADISQITAGASASSTASTSATGTSTSATGTTSASTGSFPQFDPQTLQALLAAQMSANSTSSPPSWSQFGGAGAGQQSGSAWWQRRWLTNQRMAMTQTMA